MSTPLTVNAPTHEVQGPAQVGRDIRELGVCARWISAALVVVMSAPNLLVMHAVPAFGQIFQDMLQGKPLPLLVQLLITYQMLFFILACCIPVGALVVATTMKRPGRVAAINGALAVLAVFLAAMEFMLLMLPLAQTISTMSR